jgi:hypothetical protein
MCEPCPAELIAMENVVLFPHLGSASVYTRTQMDQLVVDNLLPGPPTGFVARYRNAMAAPPRVGMTRRCTEA